MIKIKVFDNFLVLSLIYYCMKNFNGLDFFKKLG